MEGEVAERKCNFWNLYSILLYTFGFLEVYNLSTAY